MPETSKVGGASPRYFALDALRASMMFFGVAAHAALTFTVARTPDWPLHDARTSPFFDVLFSAIHIFRLPLYFAMAGFFGALLVERRGVRGLLANRAIRILLPLAVGSVTLVPLTWLAFLRARGRPMPSPRVFAGIFSSHDVMHLWFLRDLVVLYLAAAALIALSAALPVLLRIAAERTLHALMTGRAGAVAAIALTAALLLGLRQPFPRTDTTLLPPPRNLMFYGLFFAFGWLLYGRRTLLAEIARRWKLRLSAGAGATACYLLLGDDAVNPALDAGKSALAAVAVWMLLLGTTGLFLRYLDVESPTLRFLSDSSYWMYLIHLPLLVWITPSFQSVDLHPLVKFSVVLGLTCGGALLSYWWLVRPTFIGAVLNGRRRRRPHLIAASPPSESASPAAG